MNKRQIQREGTLALIYRTVNELVAEKGFEAMRIKDICDRAGLSTGAFYHHFSSKADILYERFAATMRFLGELTEDARGLSASEAVCSLMTEMIDYIRSRQPDVLVSYMREEIVHHDEWLARAGIDISLKQSLEEALKRGVADGSLRADLDADATAELLDNFQQGVILKQCESHGAYLRDHQPEALVRALVESWKRA